MCFYMATANQHQICFLGNKLGQITTSFILPSVGFSLSPSLSHFLSALSLSPFLSLSLILSLQSLERLTERCESALSLLEDALQSMEKEPLPANIKVLGSSFCPLIPSVLPPSLARWLSCPGVVGARSLMVF